MAFTARLSPEVEAAAKIYAERAGVSLNALLSIALRDYLDARPATPKSGEPSRGGAIADQHAGAAAPVPAPPERGLAARVFAPPKNRSDPCPCGALDARGYRRKWKHCHGA